MLTLDSAEVVISWLCAAHCTWSTATITRGCTSLTAPPVVTMNQTRLKQEA